MPILKYDKNGDLQEVGGELDRTRGASFVEEDDILKLSNPNKNLEIQRSAIANQKIKAVKAKLMKDLKQMVAAKRAEAKKAHAILKSQKIEAKKGRALKAKHDDVILQGLAQGYIQQHVMSGLSGYGQTSDGSSMHDHHPTHDWAPVQLITEPFGSLRFGENEMGSILQKMPVLYDSTQDNIRYMEPVKEKTMSDHEVEMLKATAEEPLVDAPHVFNMTTADQNDNIVADEKRALHSLIHPMLKYSLIK